MLAQIGAGLFVLALALIVSLTVSAIVTALIACAAMAITKRVEAARRRDPIRIQNRIRELNSRPL